MITKFDDFVNESITDMDEFLNSVDGVHLDVEDVNIETKTTYAIINKGKMLYTSKDKRIYFFGEKGNFTSIKISDIVSKSYDHRTNFNGFFKLKGGTGDVSYKPI